MIRNVDLPVVTMDRPDTASPSEGLFGTKCTCQPGATLRYKCHQSNKDIYVCSDNKAPRCAVPCN